MKGKITLFAIAFLLLSAGQLSAQYNSMQDYLEDAKRHNQEVKEYNQKVYDAIMAPGFEFTTYGESFAQKQWKNIQVGSALKTGSFIGALATNAVLVPTALAVGKTNVNVQTGLLITDGVLTGICGIFALVGICKVSAGTKWFTVQGGNVVLYLYDKKKAYNKCKRSDYMYYNE